MPNKRQKDLIKELYKNLVDIKEEAMNDGEFYRWLNENYFFKDNLGDIIVELKNVKEELHKKESNNQ